MEAELEKLRGLFRRWDAGESVGEELQHAIGVGDGFRLLRALLHSRDELLQALEPFAEKADRWEKNHPGATRQGSGRDSHQIAHRLGDFRAARDVLARARSC